MLQKPTTCLVVGALLSLVGCLSNGGAATTGGTTPPTQSPSGTAANPRFKADVPESLATPDTISTKFLGDLTYTDGFPSDATVKKTYDPENLFRVNWNVTPA